MEGLEPANAYSSRAARRVPLDTVPLDTVPLDTVPLDARPTPATTMWR
ncbi:hypothetical protein [Microbispora hainanensis]